MNLTTTMPVGTIALVRVRAKTPNPALPKWSHVYLGLKTVTGWTITGKAMSAEVGDDWNHADWVVTDVVPLTVEADAYQLGAVGLASTDQLPDSVELRHPAERKIA
jgi:hypothetical protein